MEPTWLRKPENATTIVFVHGLFSSSETAWLDQGGAYWPRLVCEDNQLKRYGIYLFSYRADVHAGTFSLENAVDAMRERFRLDEVTRKINSGCGLIFVCHSMGGILARRYIVSQQLPLVDSEIPVGLFLIASPSLGSEYANFVSAIAPFYNAQIDILRFSQENQWLNALDKDFLNIKEGTRLQVFGKELIEDNFVGSARYWRKSQIVQPMSGARYFGEPIKIEHSDHFTIAKPSSEKSIQHRLLVDFLKTTVRNTRPLEPEDANLSSDSFNPILIDWSDLLGSTSADQPSKVSLQDKVSKHLFLTGTLINAVAGAALLYFTLTIIQARWAEDFILEYGATIRGTKGTYLRHTSAKKTISYAGTGDVSDTLLEPLKKLGPVALEFEKTTYDQLLGGQKGYPIPASLGAITNVVALQIMNADGLTGMDSMGTMPHLEGLVIRNPKFASSLFFLTKMPNLKMLSFQVSGVSDLEPLTALKDLRVLSLVGLNKVSDINPIKKLNNLECVLIYGLPNLKNAEALLSLPKLKHVTITESGVEVPSGLNIDPYKCKLEH